MNYVGVDHGAEDKTVISTCSKAGISIVEPPEWAGDIVGITEYNGILVVACRNAVFSYRDGEFHPILFSK
jgi:hypothetical protein